MKYRFQRDVEDALREYPQLLAALETIPEQLIALRDEAEGIRSSASDGVPVSGGTNRREERLIENVFRRQRLERGLRIAKRRTSAMKKALDTLDERERRVIDGFYLQRRGDHVEALCSALGYEKSAVYDLKDRALVKLARALTGLSEG